MFGVYIDGRNRTDALIEKNNTDHFNLYKYTRDADDDIRKELSDLKAELAVTKAIRPYQDKLIQCEMEKMFTAGINYTDRKIPVNQFILGSSDPLLYPSEKMTNSIDEQIAFLQSQKQAINEVMRVEDEAVVVVEVV